MSLRLLNCNRYKLLQFLFSLTLRSSATSAATGSQMRWWWKWWGKGGKWKFRLLLRGRGGKWKVLFIDILYDFVIIKGHFDDDAILTPLSPESFNFLILFNISAYFLLRSVILYWVIIHFFSYLFHIFSLSLSLSLCGIEFYLLLLDTHTHRHTMKRHFLKLFTHSFFSYQP